MPKSSGTEYALSSAMDRWRESGNETGEFQQKLTIPRPWRTTPDEIEVRASYHFQRTPEGHRLSATIDGHRVPLDRPVRLEPVQIPKPWGKEIWYTGIEARGESGIQTDTGSLPLSQYLALAPWLLHGHAPLTLLKILAPRPEPVLGDLYFEMHEIKQEVYVVTHVDGDAWPGGTGGIRFGLNQAVRQHYGSDVAFRSAFLEAVKAYETVRHAIDNAAKAPDPAMRSREARLRTAMDRFTNIDPLHVGDVVVVPTRVPHSLQHGVRVVEFQTPTYERQIISFAQRVLTQNHWDSDTAIRNMRLDPPSPPSFDTIAPGWQRLVTFEDFSVWRAQLNSGATVSLPNHPSYVICMAVGGAIQLGPLELAAEQAAFVPGWFLRSSPKGASLTARYSADQPGTLLIAAPDL